MGRTICLPGEKLNPRQKALADAWLESGNGTQAAMHAYSITKRTVAGVKANQTLKKTYVQDYIKSVLAKKRVTADRIASKIDKGLDAKSIHISPIDGTVIESEDHAVQFRYVDLSCKLLSLYPTASSQGASNHLHLHRDNVVGDRNALRRLVRED